ncbi:MAG: WYL domain-containing protein [Leptospiraceae bacterium]|nr:WYL domain-containing protein [Leptospiraceae bacterium]
MLSENKPDSIKHLKKAIEIASIIFKEDGYIPTKKIDEKFDMYNENIMIYGNTVGDAIETLEKYLGKNVFEAKPRLGYRLKPQYRKNLEWMHPLLSTYLSLIELDSLNYPVESITYHLEAKALYNLYMLHYARNQKKTIKFEYVKNLETTPKRKNINVYSIILRGKLYIIGLDTDINEVRLYTFTQIKDVLEIDPYSSFEPPPQKYLSQYFKDSLISHEGSEPEEVLIRFEKRAEVYVQKEFFHSSQEFYHDENGNFFLKMFINRRGELFALLGRFMNVAELIKPTNWREEYIKDIQAALALHNNKT